jgi:hypothetical protein
MQYLSGDSAEGSPLYDGMLQVKIREREGINASDMVFNCKDYEVARAVLVTCRLLALVFSPACFCLLSRPVTAATKSRTSILIGQACSV